MELLPGIAIIAICAVLLRLRSTDERLRALERRLRALEAGTSTSAQTAASAAAPKPDAPAPRPADPSRPSPSPSPPSSPPPSPLSPRPQARTAAPFDDAATRTLGLGTAPPKPPPPGGSEPRDYRGLEELLGARWAVWIGGIALALGGLFLVRYSIEAGLFGPAARIVAGGLFAAALIGAGEWTRRHERAAPMIGLPPPYIPAVLTAAGTTVAFGTVYAAYALYGFIDEAGAFLLLGAIALGTLAAAIVHGPALAGLGLVAALAAPLLVSASEPRPWPVVLYLAAVGATAQPLARIRQWRWVGFSTVAGMVLWGIALMTVGHADSGLPAAAHTLIQMLLAACAVIGGGRSGRRSDGIVELDQGGAGIIAAMAWLAYMVAASLHDPALLAAFGAIVIALYLALATQEAGAATAAPVAALLAAGTLYAWPLRMVAGLDTPDTVARGLPAAAVATALPLYLGGAILAGAAIAATSLRQIVRRRGLGLDIAASYVGAAAAGPILILLVVYWRVTDFLGANDLRALFPPSTPFAIAGFALAGAAMATTAYLRRMPSEAGVDLAVGAMASAATAAIAFGLTFALDRGMLTVGFALAALGTAWVARETTITPLRYAVAAFGIIVLVRVAIDPAIAGDRLGTTPIFNWLLFGYGIPAASFGAGGRLLRRERDDRVSRFCEGLAQLFSVLLVFFEIRHALNRGDVFAPRTGPVEIGLMTTSALTYAMLFARLDRGGVESIYRLIGDGFAVVAGLLAVVALCVVENPLFSGDEVAGGAIVNTLLLAYLLPAVLAALLAERRPYRDRAPWRMGGQILATSLLMNYTGLEIRRLFHGPAIDLDAGWDDAELWSYSAALILYGVAALALGIRYRRRSARMISAGLIAAAVLKVFLIDLSDLTGVLRALSFIALGLVLIGIGMIYQRIVRQEPAPPA